MLMPMMQIRPVFMSVLLGFVFMPVYMAPCVINLIMIVIVMEPIMPVEVLVQYRRKMGTSMFLNLYPLSNQTDFLFLFVRPVSIDDSPPVD